MVTANARTLGSATGAVSPWPLAREPDPSAPAVLGKPGGADPSTAGPVGGPWPWPAAAPALSSRSVYLASRSASRFTASPTARWQRLVLAQVWGITAIQKSAPSALQPATVRLMPSTATLAFSQM